LICWVIGVEPLGEPQQIFGERRDRLGGSSLFVRAVDLRDLRKAY
jgi:hypothetical protein